MSDFVFSVKHQARMIRNLLFCAVILAVGAARPAAAPFVLQLETDPGLHSVALNFVLDFTYSPEDGVRVLELGSFFGSKFDGYRLAYPQMPHPDIQMTNALRAYVRKQGFSPIIFPVLFGNDDQATYLAMREDWLDDQLFNETWVKRFSADRALINVSSFGPYPEVSPQALVRQFNPTAMIAGIDQNAESFSRLLMLKVFSTLLHTPENARLRPDEILANYKQISDPAQLAEIVRQVGKFPGDVIIVKSGITNSGDEIYSTTKSMLANFFEEIYSYAATKTTDPAVLLEAKAKAFPLIVQSYHPSDMNGFSPVGRAAFTVFYDADHLQVTVQPLIMYWKTFVKSTLPLRFGDKLNFNDKSGVAVGPALRTKLFSDLSLFMKSIFLRAAAINEHGLLGENPISQKIRDELNEGPVSRLESLDYKIVNTKYNFTPRVPKIYDEVRSLHENYCARSADL